MPLRIFAFFFIFLVSGCASLSPSTTQFLVDRTDDTPEKVRLNDVPFVPQSSDQCGPASLAMVAKRWGYVGDLRALEKSVYTPGLNGSLQADMIGAARRLGLLAVPIHGTKELFEEVANGHPVVVLQNLGLSWWPVWHFSVVVGYDLERRVILLHSGPEQFREESLFSFDASWTHSKHWGLVVLRPDELPVAPNQLNIAKGAVALEDLGFLAEAKTAYTAMLNRWPDNLIALMGLGNLAAREGRWKVAADHFLQATTFYPNSKAAQQNLKVAKSQLK